MAGTRRRPVALAGSAADDDVPEMTDIESVCVHLRQRWELASVLNFLHVFHPIIGKDLKLSPEDVETAIIEQNITLAQLHIALLKGILPANQAAQTLKSADSWMVALSNTLSTWWPWVAEGDFPLTGAKGEEISIYKELEPTTRLVILKALCEVRADQYDAQSYINEKLKNGTELSFFRKDRLASDGKGVSFWYDGSETIGHRLYKEVHLFEKRGAKSKGTAPSINCQWETLATNLEEFNTIVNEFSSSKYKWEVDLSKSIATDVIPVLEKQLKKKQRAQDRLQREQLLLNGFRNTNANRSRSCKHVDYKFDNYDKAITEAIKYANKRKTSEELIKEEKPSQKRATSTSNGSNDSTRTSRDGESTETDTESRHEESDAEDSNDEEYVEEKEGDSKMDVEGGEKKVHSHKQNVCRPRGSRFSKRLAGVPSHTIPESVNLGLKNRLRQRPSLNTAVEHTVIPDSEDESSPGDQS